MKAFQDKWKRRSLWLAGSFLLSALLFTEPAFAKKVTHSEASSPEGIEEKAEARTEATGEENSSSEEEESSSVESSSKEEADEQPKEEEPQEAPITLVREGEEIRFRKGDTFFRNEAVHYEGGDYFVDPRGYAYRNRFISFGPTRYLMGADGKKQHGYQVFRGNAYLLDEQTGILHRDNAWVRYQGKDYFPNQEGVLYRDRFISFGPAITYYMNRQGNPHRGLLNRNNRYYLLDEKTGRLHKDNAWVSYRGKNYFPNAQGVLYRNRFIFFGPEIAYYMTDEGTPYHGLLELGERHYLLDPMTGRLHKDNAWVEYRGESYFPNAQGVLYRNRWIYFGAENAYYLDRSGKVSTGEKIAGLPYHAIVTDTLYLVDSQTGKRVLGYEGWVKRGKDTYFMRKTGIPYRNRVIYFGNKEAYYMGKDGRLRHGLIDEGGKQYYARKDNGNIYRNHFVSFGPRTVYFATADGSFARGWWKVDGNRYYFDASARFPKMLKNQQRVIGGVTYRFDNLGRAEILDGFRFRDVFQYRGNFLTTKLGTRRVNGDHVVISLPNQYLWIFNNHKLVRSFPIISGKPDTPTVTGYFNIMVKAADVVLRGPGYASHVDWWIPFYPHYGIHDAYWQPSHIFQLDGKAYTWRGSHGCVNVDVETMKQAAPFLRQGMPVTVIPMD